VCVSLLGCGRLVVCSYTDLSVRIFEVRGSIEARLSVVTWLVADGFGSTGYRPIRFWLMYLDNLDPDPDGSRRRPRVGSSYGLSSALVNKQQFERVNNDHETCNSYKNPS